MATSQAFSAFYCCSARRLVIPLHLHSYLFSSSSSPSVCGSLVDVFLDGQCHGSWAVHSSKWSIRLLAVHSSCHSAAVLDATGTDCHHAQNPWVDAHGNVDVSSLLTKWQKLSSYSNICQTFVFKCSVLLKTDLKDHRGGCLVSWGGTSAVGSAVWACHCRSSQSATGPDTTLLSLAGRTMEFVFVWVI